MEKSHFKGEPLSQADLVRNYILMRFRYSLGDGGEQERVYREIWHPMEARLGNALEDFLWHYAIKDGDNVKKPKVYSAVKQKLSAAKEASDVELQVSEMNKSSINYSRFLQPGKEANGQIKKELMLLSRFEATISYPILLKLFAACDNNQFEEEILIKCLRHLNSFIVRRAVCDEKRSALNRLFVIIAARIPTDTERLDEWMYTELTKRVRSERWPDDTEIRTAVIGTNLYGTKAARVVLEGIEAYIAGKEVVDLNSEKITVEHIMPQTLNADWSCHIGEKRAEEIHKKYLDTLGNLTLTGINSELSNLSFSDKKKMYADSGISMNRALMQFDRWSEPEIIRRAQMIADYTIKIWPR